VSLCAGLWGIGWGWWNMRDNRRLPWSEAAFWSGVICGRMDASGLYGSSAAILGIPYGEKEIRIHRRAESKGKLR
jgi:hypothetical protein